MADILVKVGIYSGLQIVANYDEPKKKELALDIGSFTLSQILYDYIKDYRLLPTKTLAQYQDYIFTVLFQGLYNQIFFPDNFKKLIIDELLVIITLFTGNKIQLSSN